MGDYYFENHRGQKIETGSFYVRGSESIPYSIHLCKEECFFFVKSKNEDLISIIKEHNTVDDWREDMDTLLKVRKQMRRIEEIFEKATIEQIRVETEVLIYNLKMNLCSNEKDEVKDDLYSTKDNALSFAFRKVTRVDVNDAFVEYFELSDEGHPVHVASHDWDHEIPWSPEAEILFENIADGLESLLLKLDDFFGEGSMDLLVSIRDGKLLGFSEKS